ncbi:MAG: CAP domain-containing protein [Gammaproteobacteria bacterium]|nr:CAP domain-containing protein [Gammaproteobacteria bacterium]
MISTSARAGVDAELAGVNRVRVAAGLPTLLPQAQLTEAARRHAAYLDRHRQPGADGQGGSAHTQHPGQAGFTGATPESRALAAGYPHREVLENVSMGYDSAETALEDLMSAIYHRLTFLDLESDQVGVAVGERSRVFVLGRADLDATCKAPPAAALARQPVDCLGRLITRDAYEALCADVPAEAAFEPAHPVACPGGMRLDAAFMRGVCASPPPGARFQGIGRYYQPCADDTRLRAEWFDVLCAAPPPVAVYRYSGHYYEICDDARKVHAGWLEARCAALPEDDLFRDSGRYRRPCGEDHDIRVEYLQEMDLAQRADLPSFVVWPVDGAKGVTPAFFIEEPDPLPQHDVSGFPLSVQFNPSRVRRVTDVAMTLSRVENGKTLPVGDWLLLDEHSDPNGLLNSHEFALFPLQRLAWGAQYEAGLSALLDGEPFSYRWRFDTAGTGMPLLTLDRQRRRFVVQSGRDYLLYLPPADGQPMTVLSSRSRHIRGNRVDIDMVDPNTLKVKVDATWCDRISISFDGDREAVLIPAGCPG